MTSYRSPIDEVAELLNLLCEGKLTKEGASRLEELIVSDPDACEYYLQYIELHDALHVYYTSGEGSAGREQTCSGAAQTGLPSSSQGQSDSTPGIPLLGGLGDWGQGFGSMFPHVNMTLMGMLAILVILNAGLLVGLSVKYRNSCVTPQQLLANSVDHGAARLTGTVDCIWESRPGEKEISGGDFIQEQREFRLLKGVAEITFRSGACVTLEGPAVFHAEHKNAMFLTSGQMVASVPDEAFGFTVNTPRLNVVDLGTEFAVKADTSFDAEVHVLKGVVKARGRKDGRISDDPKESVRRIIKGQALRLAGCGVPGFKKIDAIADRIAFSRYKASNAAKEEIDKQYRYVKGGPVGGTTITKIQDNSLAFSPTVPGHALIYDTGTLTTNSCYRISREQFSRIAPQKYQIRSGIVGYAVPGKGALGAWTGPDGLSLMYGAFHDRNPHEGGDSRIDEWQINQPDFFLAKNQTVGDGVSDLNPWLAHNVTMSVHDTGSDDTSTFRYTFKQESNEWVFEVTFAQLREAAEQDAPGQGGLFVDGLIADSRSKAKQTGYAYYVFGWSAKYDNDKVECKWARAGK